MVRDDGIKMIIFRVYLRNWNCGGSHECCYCRKLGLGNLINFLALQSCPGSGARMPILIIINLRWAIQAGIAVLLCFLIFVQNFSGDVEHWRLFEFHANWCHLNSLFLAASALQSDWRGEDGSMLFIVDDVFDWGQEDVVVEIDEAELVAVAVVERVSVGVIAEN